MKRRVRNPITGELMTKSELRWYVRCFITDKPEPTKSWFSKAIGSVRAMEDATPWELHIWVPWWQWLRRSYRTHAQLVVDYIRPAHVKVCWHLHWY